MMPCAYEPRPPAYEPDSMGPRGGWAKQGRATLRWEDTTRQTLLGNMLSFFHTPDTHTHNHVRRVV